MGKRSTIDVGIINKKRRIRNTVTTLESFANEILYEIFEYLDFFHAFQAFHSLNQRFQQLFDHSNLPITINVSSISKSVSKFYLESIIKSNINRIQIFRISNPFASDMCSSLSSQMKNFTQLTTLIINNVESNFIESILDHLLSLSFLSSLTINSLDYTQKQNEIYRKILLLPRLIYCELSIETRKNILTLSHATNHFSPIQHFIIKNAISNDLLHSLLTYIPHIRRLSIHNLNKSIYSNAGKILGDLTHLKNVSIKICRLSCFTQFDFEQLIIRFFTQIESLSVTVERRSFWGYKTIEYLDVDRWKYLISIHMPHLRIFNFQHEIHSWSSSNDRIRYENCVNKFHSSFWINRQWFFDHQFSHFKSHKIAFFYSVNPYRRKSFELCKQSKQNLSNSILQIIIHNSEVIEQFDGVFSNAKELIFRSTFNKLDDYILTNLNRIIPLNKLTKLDINYQYLTFKQILKLLSLASNIQTLIFDFKYIREEKDDELFQLILNQNHVINLTLTKECSLDKLQLCLTLFPFVQFLTINLYQNDLKSIARFLLSKLNPYTRCLSHIFLSKRSCQFMNILTNLCQSEDLRDCTLKMIDRRVHIWC